MDSGNHGLNTLEIKYKEFDMNKERYLTDWELFRDDNFIQVEIGDSVVKERGTLFCRVINDEKGIKLYIDTVCNQHPL